jgi:ectoine hydroxylase-related dioxygenase (phytanoyl-CoA dioxygenase family)
MVTLRVHIDKVDEDNGPLLIALGSHRRGLIPEAAVESVVKECEHFACMADAGDVWVYATPVLHASDRVVPGRRRRVLQVDYSAEDLPSPLEWLGVA